MNKFKIGDIVQVIDQRHAYFGIIGTVHRLWFENDYYGVKFIRNDGHEYSLFEWRLSLYKKTTVKKFGIVEFCERNYR